MSAVPFILAVTHDGTTSKRCEHRPERLYAWYAADGVLCVACCDCGAILRGAT